MRRFVVVATMQRGALAQPEALSDADQYRANTQVDLDDAEAVYELRRRATLPWGRERDPLMTEAEECGHMKHEPYRPGHVEAGRIQRMMRLAMGRR